MVKEQVRVLVVDSQSRPRSSLHALLAAWTEEDKIREARNGAQAFELVEEFQQKCTSRQTIERRKISVEKEPLKFKRIRLHDFQMVSLCLSGTCLSKEQARVQ